MVTLSQDSKEALDALALQRNMSVSKTAALLIDFALEVHEDEILTSMADKRVKKSTDNYLTHEDVWK